MRDCQILFANTQRSNILHYDNFITLFRNRIICPNQRINNDENFAENLANALWLFIDILCNRIGILFSKRIDYVIIAVLITDLSETFECIIDTFELFTVTLVSFMWIEFVYTVLLRCWYLLFILAPSSFMWLCYWSF